MPLPPPLKKTTIPEGQFQVNKWVRLALTVLMGVIGTLVAVDWTQYVDPKTGGTIVGVLALIKAAYEAFAPSSDKATVPTGGSIVSHEAVPARDITINLSP